MQSFRHRESLGRRVLPAIALLAIGAGLYVTLDTGASSSASAVGPPTSATSAATTEQPVAVATAAQAAEARPNPAAPTGEATTPPGATDGRTTGQATHRSDPSARPPQVEPAKAQQAAQVAPVGTRRPARPAVVRP